MAWMAAAAFFGAAGAFSGGSSARGAGRRDAAVARINAAIVRDQAAAEILRQKVFARKTQGAMRAAYGAAGVAVEGSPLDVLEESAATAELDRLTIKYRGDVRAMGYQYDATESERRGDDAYTAGLLNAGSSIFGAFGNRS